MRNAWIALVLCVFACHARGVTDVAGAQKAAEAFLGALSRSDVHAAYGMLAPEWRAHTDEAAFTEWMRAASLVGARLEPSVWHASKGDAAWFTATTATPEGPMTIDVFAVHEGSGWFIARVHSPGYPWPKLPPLGEEVRRRMPPQPELQALVARVVRAQKKFVVDGDANEMADIRKNPAAARAHSPPLGAEAARVLTSAVGLTPVLIGGDTPGDGAFRVDALYATEPQLQLRSTFEKREGGWALTYLRMRTLPKTGG